MPCYFPHDVYRKHGGGIAFKNGPGVFFDIQFTIPCGQCGGCLLDWMHDRAAMIWHESLTNEHTAFLTLTLDNDNYPEDGSLDHSLVKRFHDRARHELGPFRFAITGEYGEQTGRAHWHDAVYGIDFMALKHVKLWGKNRHGHTLYHTPVLDDLWGLGRVLFGSLDPAAAAYVAPYITKHSADDYAPEKRITVAKDTPQERGVHWQMRTEKRELPKLDAKTGLPKTTPAGRPITETVTQQLRPHSITGDLHWVKPEYHRTSNRPGIGSDFVHQHYKQLLAQRSIIWQDRERRIPKPYWRILERLDPHGTAHAQREIRREAILRARNSKEQRYPEEIGEARRTIQRKRRQSVGGKAGAL